MTCLTPFSLRQPSWIGLMYLAGIFMLQGCAAMDSLVGKNDSLKVDAFETEEVPPPPPTIEEVQEAIASTKTLLDDQQKQVGELLTLRGEVQQTLREFRDQDITPLKNTMASLRHQVESWEGATATNHTTVTAALTQLEQEVEQAKTRVGIYGDQVTALVDQIDQNNRQYEKLLTEFQNSLVGFKGVMGELKVELKAEQDRATQEEKILATQLQEQNDTLTHVSNKAKEILVLQKRLNQLHVYINQVRDKMTSDTTALQAALNPEERDKLRDVVASLEERYQQLAHTASSDLASPEELHALEERIGQSEKQLAETIQTLQADMQKFSMEAQAGSDSPDAENLQALVLGLEERYQQMLQAPPPNLALSEHIESLEQRVDQSEKHYTETIKALHEDIQELSTGMRASLQNEETEKLQALVASLEHRYQKLNNAPSTPPAFTEQLQALQQRVEQSEKRHAETVNALKQDVQGISAKMVTLAQSLSAETVEALHHDIQEVSAGMLKLAQSISQMEKSKSSPPSIPIHAGSISDPKARQ